MKPREITDPLEEIGEEFCFDSRTSFVTGWTDARTVVQENRVGLTCSDDDNQHSFTFWVDPRTVDYS